MSRSVKTSVVAGAAALSLVAACRHVIQPSEQGIAGASASAVALSDAPAIETPADTAAPPSAGDGQPLIDITSTHGDKNAAGSGVSMAANGGGTGATKAATPSPTGTATSAGASSAAAAPSGSAAAPQVSPDELKKSQGLVVERDGALMKELGGTYLCDQRVYPSGGGGHVSAWEWAFPTAPNALAESLALKLKGATRSGLTLRLGDSVVVDIKDGTSGKTTLGCLGVPITTKSLVVVSVR